MRPAFVVAEAVWQELFMCFSRHLLTAIPLLGAVLFGQSSGQEKSQADHMEHRGGRRRDGEGRRGAGGGGGDRHAGNGGRRGAAHDDNGPGGGFPLRRRGGGEL